MRLSCRRRLGRASLTRAAQPRQCRGFSEVSKGSKSEKPQQEEDSGLPSLLRKFASHKSAPAIVDGRGVYRYDELLQVSAGIAKAVFPLKQMDSRQRRVAFFNPRDHTYVLNLLTCWQAGAIAQPLPEHSPAAELQYLLQDSTPSLLLTDQESPLLAGLAAEVGAEMRVTRSMRPAVVSGAVAAAASQAADGEKGQGKKSKRGSGHKLFYPYHSDGSFCDSRAPGQDGALLIYTSGTTGRPKGVLTRHSALEAQIKALHTAWAWTAQDRILHVLPLHHVHGLMAVLLGSMYAGAVCEMLPKFDPAAVWSALTRPAEAPDSLSLFMAVPAVYAKLLQYHAEQDPSVRSKWKEALHRDSRIRLMVSGSAALPEPVMHQWREVTGHTLLERYGMTEWGLGVSNPLLERKPFSPPIIPATATTAAVAGVGAAARAAAEAASAGWAVGPRKPSSVGLPLPGFQFRIVEELQPSKVLPARDPAQAGELQVRGPAVLQEYWKKPQATAEAFVEGGWFRTGDCAKQDEEGYFYILGRLSADIIKTGGFKISALETERVLLEHTGIKEVAVMGIADDTWGERVAAMVAVHANHPAWSTKAAVGEAGPAGSAADTAAQQKLLAEAVLKELRSFCKEKLAPYKLPTLVQLVQEIPRNAMGKTNKKELRKHFQVMADSSQAAAAAAAAGSRAAEGSCVKEEGKAEGQ